MTSPGPLREELLSLVAGTRPLSSAASGDVLRDSTIVVVDDAPANVTLLERLLAAAGVTAVRGFTDPVAALEDCRRSRPDLVLLDLHMPHVDGFAFMVALQDLVPAESFLPVLVLTADVTTEVRQRALAAGAKDFLTKPFDQMEVALRVRNLLETGALHSRLERHNSELRATVEAHAAAGQAAVADRQRRRQRIDAVLGGEGLRMVFQPIAELATNRVVGVEALARFVGEPHRTPDAWFAEAADVDRGVDLELAAVGAALAELDRLEPHAFMAVNVSAAAVATGELGQLLASHPAERVTLELTEHERVDDYGALIDRLVEPRDHGVRLAIDDTGAGYAGFQHILRLRPDILKLDVVLTRGIDADPVRRALATALVAFAEEIGAGIIAEGVETPEELAVLQYLGIPWAQGFYLAHPASLPVAPLHLAGSPTIHLR